jgi:HEAT repeat protein
MTIVRKRSAASKLLILSFGFLICILVCYAVLSIGIVDEVFIVPNRPDILDRIEIASSNDPPDIEFLIDMLGGPDWYAAAVAADRIGSLRQSDKLKPEQASAATNALFRTLASGGHWWRFGWDRDDPDFEQFRGAAIKATAGFGATALPRLLAATASDSPFEREAACSVTLAMIKSNSIDRVTLSKQEIYEHIVSLAKSEQDENVKQACISVQDTLNLQLP